MYENNKEGILIFDSENNKHLSESVDLTELTDFTGSNKNLEIILKSYQELKNFRHIMSGM